MSKIETKWLEDYSVTKHKVNLDVVGPGLSGGGGNSVFVLPSTSGGIEVESDGVKIKNNSPALYTGESGIEVVTDNISLEIDNSVGLKVKDIFVKDIIYDLVQNTRPISGSGDYIIDSPGERSEPIVSDYILDFDRKFHSVAVWIHPTDPSNYRIIISDNTLTTGGICVYSQENNGTFTELQNGIGSLPSRHIDIRQDISLSGGNNDERIDVVVSAYGDPTIPANNVIKLFEMTSNGVLSGSPISIHSPIGDPGYDIDEVDGCCFYRSERLNEYNVLISSNTVGLIKQYKVTFLIGKIVTWEHIRDIVYVADGNGAPDVVTNLNRIEYMQTDDHYGFIYMTMYDEIRRYRGDVEGLSEITYISIPVFNTIKSLKGITLYETSDDDGYIIFANVDTGSGSTEYLVYDRRLDYFSDSNKYIGWFEVNNGAYNINGADMKVVPTHLGNNIEKGALFCIDNNSEDYSLNVIKWQKIALGFDNQLLVDRNYNKKTNKSAYYTRPLISYIIEAIPLDQGPVVIPVVMSRAANVSNSYLQWGTAINSDEIPMLIPYKSTPLAVSCTVANATQFYIYVYQNNSTPYSFTNPVITIQTPGTNVSSVYDSSIEDQKIIWEEGTLLTIRAQKITAGLSNPAVVVWVRTLK